MLTLPYPPSANRMWRNYRGLMITNEAMLAYKRDAGWEAKEQGAVMLEGPVVVTLDFYRPRRVGDLDNRIKVVLDTLQGIVYEDDEQVVEIHARRFEDKKHPRVEVTVAVKE